jgi:four helix bundle protein
MGVPTKIKRFEDLIVWQKSMSLAEEVYQATKQEKFAKDWELKKHIQRTAISIPSNIAEGFERYNAQELRQYLAIAKGSAGELRAQIILARNLNYLGSLEAEILIKKCEEISRMLAAYRKKVGRKK